MAACTGCASTGKHCSLTDAMHRAGKSEETRDWHERECVVVRAHDRRADETVAHLANRAAAAYPGADIALVLDDSNLPDGWLECLCATAARESTTATVCPLPGGQADDDGSGISREPSVASLLEDRGVSSPRATLVTGSCVLLTRPALDLLGGIDETLGTSAYAVADFGFRASERGLANLLAGALLIPISGAAQLSEDDRDELARRFPALWAATLGAPSAATERSLLLSRSSLRRLTVTIDARSLGANAGGTQVYTLGLITALAATGEVDIRALVGPDPGAAAQLAGLDRTSMITYEQALSEVPKTDLVHRPQQVFTIDDLNLLAPLGHRLVITHLDLIAYHNPTYFPDLSQWRRHVRATRIALAAADRVLFFSAHALRDAEREDLVDPRRAEVVTLGVDQHNQSATQETRPPGLADRDEPFMLCLGSSYSHKNRPFALELLGELRRTHGWPGILVFAGTQVQQGSSAEAERQIRNLEPELDRAAVELGQVSEPERRWLMSHARALVYPTVLEGFGLVPFEAAAANVPCLFASQSSLEELLPATLASLDGWQLERSGRLAARLLLDETARASHVAALRQACGQYTWGRCAAATIDAYRRTLGSSAVSSARQAWESLEREHEIMRLDQAVKDLEAVIDSLRVRIERLTDDFGDDAVALVGPDGLLTREDQRALLALAVRPVLRRPLLATARAGYRLARRAVRSEQGSD
jgi:glycosyltransferase involved in cell wall biosynthesis